MKKPRADKEEEQDLLELKKEQEIDIAEVFSMPRVTVEAQKCGLAIGEAIDIKTGWDLTKNR
eukprot:2843716-Karenia_brevis.AAC.1